MLQLSYEQTTADIGSYGHRINRLDSIEDHISYSQYYDITNNTNIPIKVIDHTNTCYVLDPEKNGSDSVRGYVIITGWERIPEYLGCRQVRIVKNVRSLHESKFINEAYHDTQTNIVIANIKNDTVRHPYSRRISQEYLNTVHDEFDDLFVRPPYNIIINDPKGTYKRLYCMINNRPCTVKVLQLEYEECRCELYSLDPSDSEMYFVENLDLEKIKNGECKFQLKDNTYIFIGVDKQQVINAHDAHHTHLKINADIQDLKKKYENEVNQLVLENKLQLSKSEKNHIEEVTNLKRELSTVQLELSHYREKEKREQELLQWNQKTKQETVKATTDIFKIMCGVLIAALGVVIKFKK